MKEFDWNQFGLTDSISAPIALTIGVFDGVHIGHQQLIRTICDSPELLSTVCTFNRNPGSVFGNAGYLGSILTLDQKKSKLEHLGVSTLLMIDFSHDFSKLSGRQFFTRLKQHLNIRKLVVGYNFYFGKNRDTGPEQLKSVLEGTDITLEVIPPTLYRNQVVSSSRIRTAISRGQMEQVHDMLTTGFSIDLVKAKADRQGDRLFYPCNQIEQVIPGDGFYQVSIETGTVKTECVAKINAQHLCLYTVADSVEAVCFKEKIRRRQ